MLGDMKNIFTSKFISKYDHPDVIITDPPRDGMHKDVIKEILKLETKSIVYVSCNPSTQCRDLELLKEYNQLICFPIPIMLKMLYFWTWEARFLIWKK